MRHAGSDGFGDAGFAVQGQRLALAVGDVLGGRAGHPNTAMKARQQTRLGQTLHIPAHGLQGDRKGFGQKLNRYSTLGLYQGQQLGLSGIRVHGVVFWGFGQP